MDFDLGIPPYCPDALPILPDFHLRKQIQADSGTAESKSSKLSLKPTVLLIYTVGLG